MSDEKRPPSQVDILYQDIQNLEHQLADLTQQVQRIQRVTKVDEREAAVAEKTSYTEMMRAIHANTQVVGAMLDNRRRARQDENEFDEDIYARGQQRRALERLHRLNHIRRLADAEQKIVPRCPCGKHLGLAFLEAPDARENINGSQVYLRDEDAFGIVTNVTGTTVTIKLDDREIKEDNDAIYIVLEIACPRWWWVAQSRIAFEDGKLSKFVASTPIEQYIAPFKIEIEGA